MVIDAPNFFPHQPNPSLGDVLEMQETMKQIGAGLEASDPSTEEVYHGAGDTGTIQTSADVTTSDILLTLARPRYPGSFSEEDDPHDENGPIRLWPENIARGYWMIDPVDGTGDRKKGDPGSPEKMGYSMLSTFLRDGEVQASIVVRPAYGQTIIYRNGEIAEEDKESSREPGSRSAVIEEVRRANPDLGVRVNIRNAYPEVSFPDDFWDFAARETGVVFERVRAGGAGDSLSKLVLGELDLVIARRGDWKAWDTGPFDPMIRQMNGRMTDCDSNPLQGYVEEDLWHRRGVVASIDRPDAHDALIWSMEEYKRQRGEDLVKQTYPKN